MPEHVDVLIVGAGLSGVGAACHLRRECPGRSVAILESRDAIGGTWDLFRYPGIRSDSDMFTLGYAFRPWTSPQAIADGPSILHYVRATAREYGVDRLVRFGHRVVRAEWSSATARWTVTARRTAPGPDAEAGPGAHPEVDAEASAGAHAGADEVVLTCSFLSVCSGYFRYDEGFTPEFAGAADFGGTLVHPQHWPADLDVTGRRVVVIGSGATTVTLVPELAKTAAHVTMLQRSPSYIAAVSSRDHTADRLRGRLPERLVYQLVRAKNVLLSIATYQLSRRRPATMKKLLRDNAVAKLPPGYDVDTHFAPTYAPWDQRLCAAPDGDLFRAVRAGRAELVTDTIDRFTPTGIRLASGTELPADVVVTATGLNLLVIGGMQLVVDGRPVDPADTVAYKGMMLAGVPNFSLTLGYTNASWTLKADLVARYVCRLLRHLDAHGFASATPVAPPGLDHRTLDPLIDLRSGYVLRSIAALPRQGPRAPWRLHQNYLRDLVLMRLGRLGDGVRFAPAHDAHIPAAERKSHDRLPVR